MIKHVLGVKIDDVSLNEAIKIVESWLKIDGKHYIVTPNPEFIVTAQKDLEFKKILNNADLSVPDGNGLKIGSDIVCNTPGIDLMEELIRMVSGKGFTVGFLGGRDGVAEKTSKCLQKRYPKLKVSFAVEEFKSLKDLKLLKTDLLFVAFGHPKQEKWIAENLPKIDVKVAMGVGGAFDYISGQIPRAPRWIRSLGLEWLFRLIIQPRRIKRQLALLKYLWLLTKYNKNV